MKNCSSCGKPLRDGSTFCPSCGAAAAAGAKRAPSSETAVQVPLITLAPQQNNFATQRAVRFVRATFCVLLVIALALGVAVAAAWFSSSNNKVSSFEEVENESYSKCFALVNDVRNDNFDDYVEDIINMDNDAADYNFLSEYEALFKGIIPDEGSTETEIMFRDCCFMVSYTEFCAKKYEMLSGKALIGSLYKEKADKFRGYADTLYEMLKDAKSDSQLQAIQDYCSDNDIIYLKQAK